MPFQFNERQKNLFKFTLKGCIQKPELSAKLSLEEVSSHFFKEIEPLESMSDIHTKLMAVLIAINSMGKEIVICEKEGIYQYSNLLINYYFLFNQDEQAFLQNSTNVSRSINEFLSIYFLFINSNNSIVINQNFNFAAEPNPSNSPKKRSRTLFEENHDRKIEEISKQNKDLEERLKASEAKNAKLLSDNTYLEAKNAYLETNNAKLKADNEKKDYKISGLEKKLDVAKNKIITLEMEIEKRNKLKKDPLYKRKAVGPLEKILEHLNTTDQTKTLPTVPQEKPATTTILTEAEELARLLAPDDGDFFLNEGLSNFNENENTPVAASQSIAPHAALFGGQPTFEYDVPNASPSLENRK